MKDKELRKTINHLLEDVGIKVCYKGFKYLATILFLKRDESFSCKFYEEIAKHHRTTSSKVERAIRYITQIHQEKIKSYFKVDYKITNKVLVELLRNRILEEL